MSTTSPPRLAAWLLERLVSGAKKESLIGDLAEQYEHGRSAAWYWRQVLTAILVGTARDICDHKRFAAGAALIAWLIVIPWVEITWTLYLWVSDKWIYAWTNSSLVLFEFWIPFGGGLPLVWCVGSAAIGWGSARLSGSNRATTIAASMLAQVPLSLWWTRGFWLYGQFPSGGPRLWSVLNCLWAAVVLIGMPTSTIIGGLWDADALPVRPPTR
jgi:hypothetical protein